MERRVAVRVLLVQISFFVNKRLNDGDLEPHDSEMDGTSEDSSAEIHISPAVDQALGRLIVVLSDGQAQGRAAIFVEQICGGFVHEEALNHARVAHDSGLVQRRPLPIVSLIFVEVVVRVILQECDQGAFIHLVLLQKIAEDHQRFKDLRALSRLAGNVLWLGRLRVDEPFKR